MIKFVVLFFVTASVHASPLCEVYGISDSPQSLNCSFSRDDIHLSCKEGIYFLGTEMVEAAFHYEVEEGPVPLVFKTKSRVLTVTLEAGRRYDASLLRKGKKIKGDCRH